MRAGIVHSRFGIRLTVIAGLLIVLAPVSTAFAGTATDPAGDTTSIGSDIVSITGSVTSAHGLLIEIEFAAVWSGGESDLVINLYATEPEAGCAGHPPLYEIDVMDGHARLRPGPGWVDLGLHGRRVTVTVPLDFIPVLTQPDEPSLFLQALGWDRAAISSQSSSTIAPHDQAPDFQCLKVTLPAAQPASPQPSPEDQVPVHDIGNWLLAAIGGIALLIVGFLAYRRLPEMIG